MRRMTLLFTAMAVALLLGSGTALAALVEGDNRDNTLTGTPMSDIIHAYGDDHLVSRDLNSSGIGKRDVVDCGPGYDTFAADYEDRVLDNCEEGSVGGF